MAGIELGLALCGLYGHTTYFKSACLRLLIDLTSRSVGSLMIYAPSNGESKDRAAGTYMSCKSKSRRLFYWREHTAHMFIRTQSYVCLCLFACECVCAQSLWLYAHWLDIEQISWLQIPEHIHVPVSCLPGIMLVSVRAPRATSHSCFVWHFVCLVFLLCFLPCLDWPRLKTIRYHDLTFSQKTSPLLFLHFLVFIV